jgi:hypothetical protein
VSGTAPRLASRGGRERLGPHHDTDIAANGDAPDAPTEALGAGLAVARNRRELRMCHDAASRRVDRQAVRGQRRWTRHAPTRDHVLLPEIDGEAPGRGPELAPRTLPLGAP